MLKTGLIAVGFALAACGGSSGPATHFSATLSGAKEYPTQVTTSGTGTATYTTDGGSVDYTITFSGLSANATAGHIHVGSATEAGGVVVPFTLTGQQKATSATVTGNFAAADVKAGSTASTTIAVGDINSLLTAMRAGNTYTNIHTGNNPNGEIRGNNSPQ